MIEVRNLVKKYGNHLAIDHLDFKLEAGRVYGFLGTNGAGKSTTMNIITGYLGATEGQVLIGGHDILKEPEAAKRQIGYLPEQPPLYMEMTVREYLEFAAELKKIPGKDREKAVDEVEKLVKVRGVEDRLIKNLSKGYRQRVGLAQAVLGFPDIIILDEPTVGLDPKQIVEIRTLIRRLAKNHTVILSSHILAEVREVCDYILIISGGKLVASDTPDNLEKLFAGTATLELTVKGSEEQARAVLGTLPGVSALNCRPGEEKGHTCLSLETDPPADLSEAAFRACAAADLPILRMDMRRASLEDVFLELTAADQPEVPAPEDAEEKEEEV